MMRWQPSSKSTAPGLRAAAADRRHRHEAVLAQVLVAKYCDHLPLYRQAQIFARNGIDLDR